MKITESADGLPARKILTACAVDRTVLAAVAERWPDKEGLFDSRHANIVGRWCVDHYRKFHKAPKGHLETIHDDWAQRHLDKELVKAVGSLMLALSKEYAAAKSNPQSDYLIDLAGKLFKKVQLKRRNREIDGLLELGDVDKASSLAEAYAPLQMGGRSWVKGTAADDSLRRAFERAEEPPLITFPGAAGEFFGNTFHRGAFVVAEGPDKRGKTTFLTDVSYRAMSAGHKVAFFAVGDMDQGEMLTMFARRGTGRPMPDTSDPNGGRKFKYPLGIGPGGGASSVVHEERERDTLTFGGARAFWRKFNAAHGSDDLLRIAAYPNDSISVLGILAELKAWERRGWVPSVISIDYLDLLTPISVGKVESREQIDQTWKKARSLGQIFNACVVSVSQTDADAYTAEVITMKNFSGSKGKNAHVTAMLGLNQTDEEKEAGLMKYNFVNRRKGKFLSSAFLHAAGCPAVGNPFVVTTM